MAEVIYTYRDRAEQEYSRPFKTLEHALKMAWIDGFVAPILGFSPLRIEDGERTYGPVEILQMVAQEVVI